MLQELYRLEIVWKLCIIVQILHIHYEIIYKWPNFVEKHLCLLSNGGGGGGGDSVNNNINNNNRGD